MAAERTAPAVARARLCLLGGWQVVVDGVEVELGHREQRLAALLGLTGRRARLQVAGTLWPDSTDARALASLRRAVLQSQQRCPGLLSPDRASIGLDPAVEVDVDDVRRAAGLTELPMAEGEAGALLATLRGEGLLPGWYDDWVIPERERLEQLRVRAMDRIARHALEAGDLALAVDASRAVSEIDPLLESAREVAIRAHLGRDDLGSALREYHRYCDAMKEQLDAPPSGRIQALVDPVPGRVADPPRVAVPAQRRAATAARVAREVSAPTRPATAAPAPSRPVPPGPVAAEEVTGSTRAAAARLLALAGVVLAAALVLAGVGLGDEGGEAGLRTVEGPRSGPGPTSPSPVGSAGTSPGPDRLAPVARQVVVRPVDAPAGRAVFVVRATQRPAPVRLEVHGPAGVNVVRNMVVRGPEGRQVVLPGLRPGTYTWAATAPAATLVTGRVTVEAGRPAAPSATVQPVTQAPTTAAATPPPPASAAGSTEEPSATSAPAPASGPGPTDQSAPTQQPTQQPSPTRTPSPTDQPGPTGEPTDPGTETPTPVG